MLLCFIPGAWLQDAPHFPHGAWVGVDPAREAPEPCRVRVKLPFGLGEVFEIPLAPLHGALAFQDAEVLWSYLEQWCPMLNETSGAAAGPRARARGLLSQHCIEPLYRSSACLSYVYWAGLRLDRVSDPLAWTPRAFAKWGTAAGWDQRITRDLGWFGFDACFSPAQVLSLSGLRRSGRGEAPRVTAEFGIYVTGQQVPWSRQVLGVQEHWRAATAQREHWLEWRLRSSDAGHPSGMPLGAFLHAEVAVERWPCLRAGPTGREVIYAPIPSKDGMRADPVLKALRLKTRHRGAVDVVPTPRAAVPSSPQMSLC